MFYWGRLIGLLTQSNAEGQNGDDNQVTLPHLQAWISDQLRSCLDDDLFFILFKTRKREKSASANDNFEGGWFAEFSIDRIAVKFKFISPIPFWLDEL